MATASQLARTGAAKFDRRYRVFVGAPLAYVSHALYVQGEPVSLPPETTLTAAFNIATDTIINVEDTTGYATADTLVLTYFDPNSRQIKTGIFAYTGKTSTTFMGVTYISGWSYFGIGAKTSQWHDITDLIYTDSIDGESFLEPTKKDWYFEIRGHSYNDELLPNDCTIMIQERLTPENGYGVWTNWIITCYGWIRDFDPVMGDVEGLNNWQATISSISSYVEGHEIAGRKYGATNLAVGATVTASAHLTNPLLEIEEWRGAVGTTEPNNLTDEIRDTVYISSDVPSLDEETPGTSSAEQGVVIDEVFCWGDSSYPDDLQFFVIKAVPGYDGANGVYAENSIRLDRIGVRCKMTVYGGITGGDEKAFTGGNYYIRLPDVSLGEDTPAIILCRNTNVFRRYFGVDASIQVYDWRFLGGFSNDGLTAADVILDPVGDCLQLRVDRNGAPFRVVDMVAWGTFSTFWYSPYDSTESGAQWDDNNTVAVPSDNHSIRRVPTITDTNDTDDWQAEEEPLLHIVTSNDGIYFSVQLPEWEAHLTGDITDSVPANGDDLTLDDASNLPLAHAIQINTEKISYTNRIGNTLKNITRGYDSTTPASHTTAALVYMVDDELGSGLGAHRLPLVDKFVIRRQVRTFSLNGATIKIAPVFVEAWATTESNPNYVGDGAWKETWTTETPLYTYNVPRLFASAEITTPINPPRRMAHAMARIRLMSDYDVEGQSGRGKANEFEVYKKQISVNDNPIDNDYVGIGAVFFDLLSEVVPPANITIEADAFAGTSGDIEIAGGDLGAALDELCEQYGAMIKYGRDNRVTVGRNPFHPQATKPPLKAAFTRAMMRARVEPPRVARRSRARIGQYIVELTNDVTKEVFQGRYPANSGGGAVKKVQLRATGASVQIATEYAAALYLGDAETSQIITFATFGACEWLEAGDRILVFDRHNQSNVDGRYVNCLVQSVRWGYEKYARVIAQEWRMR